MFFEEGICSLIFFDKERVIVKVFRPNTFTVLFERNEFSVNFRPSTSFCFSETFFCRFLFHLRFHFRYL